MVEPVRCPLFHVRVSHEIVWWWSHVLMHELSAMCVDTLGEIFRARLNYIHLMCEFSAFFGAPNHCPLSAAERHVCEEIYGNLHLTNDHTQWNIPRKSGTPAGGQLFTRMWERSALSAGQQWEFEMICLRNHRLCAWLLLISSDSQDQQPRMINF